MITTECLLVHKESWHCLLDEKQCDYYLLLHDVGYQPETHNEDQSVSNE